MTAKKARSDQKLCRGPLHRGGVWLPLVRFRTDKEGKPLAACIECRATYLGRKGYQVAWFEVQPVLDALLVRLKTKSAICDKLRWNRAVLSRGFKTLHKEKFDAMCHLLADIQQEEAHHYSRKGEAEIVDAEPLGSYLRAWIKRWLAERPHNPQGVYGQQQPGYYMGPMDWLFQKTDINVRRVSGICNGEFPRVPLSQADALLVAIGENWRLTKLGDVKVKPNPQWSNEHWYQYMRDRGCF